MIDPSTGAVAGDSWGEQDTRFSYIAVSCLSLLGLLHILDDPQHELLPPTLKGRKVRDLVVGQIERCRNFDGGFGAQEGSETHGGQSEFQRLEGELKGEKTELFSISYASRAP